MIYEFRNEYSFLSNFYPCKVIYNGNVFNSSEHAYMSAKSNEDWWLNFCLTEIKPGKVKTMSKSIKLIDNWEEIKVKVMYDVLLSKFSNEHLKMLLLNTGNENIVEGNYHGDKFWGVDLRQTPNIGENHLGRLQMGIRSKIKREEK